MDARLLRFAFPLSLVSILTIVEFASARAECSGSHGDREKVLLGGTWRFIGSNTLIGAEAIDYDDSAWDSVQVPHTWDNVYGVMRYTNSWYRTHFTIPVTASDKSIYLCFEGVFQVADVYVNAQYLGQHRGGYTRFSLEATSAINFRGDNVLAVKVSNANCSDCLPDGTPRLFKGYGGIYRKAWYLITNRYHVATIDYASSGIYITPSNIGADSADLAIATLVTNDDLIDRVLTVENTVTDADENPVLELQQDVFVPAGSTVGVTQNGTVVTPQLWSPSNPYLYNVHTHIWVDGAVTDAVDEHTGFRYYQLTLSDFTFNGSSLKLRGICKQQETEYSANAVSDGELIADWDNIQDLGVNFVRLAHYPHSELEYNLADQRGLLVWGKMGKPTQDRRPQTATTSIGKWCIRTTTTPRSSSGAQATNRRVCPRSHNTRWYSTTPIRRGRWCTPPMGSSRRTWTSSSGTLIRVGTKARCTTGMVSISIGSRRPGREW